MPKQIKIANVDSKFCMTVRELRGALSTFDENSPVIIKVNGKNYRYAEFQTTNGKPVLIGKRGQRD